MTRFKVIKGIKKERPDYFMIYARSFASEIEQANKKHKTFSKYDRDTLKKLAWLGVKMIIASESRSSDWEGLRRKSELTSIVNGIIKVLTPRELQNIFPITKEYNGEKWGSKDYFYTQRYIESFGEDEVIGERVIDFLWEYQNDTIRLFMVEMMRITSDIRILETGKGLMEEFLEEQGVPTYTTFKGLDGKGYIENNQTGEISEVKKPIPRYLKVIK